MEPSQKALLIKKGGVAKEGLTGIKTLADKWEHGLDFNLLCAVLKHLPPICENYDQIQIWLEIGGGGDHGQDRKIF
jgi:hypothetical protein